MLHISIISIITGYPHNPYNGVICNDVIAASGVFTTKELWKYSKGRNVSINIINFIIKMCQFFTP